MSWAFSSVTAPEHLHHRVTRVLALQVIKAERDLRSLVFPNEAKLCQQLGVSRTILREAVKVLADKGMVEVRPRSGTRAKPAAEWNLLDPDILGWQAQFGPDPQFLQNRTWTSARTRTIWTATCKRCSFRTPICRSFRACKKRC
jgi:GntR family galactonate operon transcriptional repressor